MLMNICFFGNGFCQNGGIGRVTAIVANALAQKYSFEIVLLSYLDEKLPNLYEIADNIQMEYFLQDYQSMTNVLLHGGEKKLRKLLLKKEIDVLIACGALYFPIAVRACKGTKIKCICWEHTDPNTGNDYRFQRLARSYGAKRSHCNVVLTKRAQKFYETHFSKARTMQIYNPLDTKVLDRAGEYCPESRKIISVGRLTYPKNFQLAVEIAAEILPAHPDWQWDIYGEGEDRQALEQMIAEKGLTEQMHLRGQVSDLYDRYREYAIMVMTSRYEGFPMSLLEGLGNGLPLVSFDINTGPDEIIRDGENGYLIPAFDKPLMCSQIVRLMEDPALRSAMSGSSKIFCREFAQETILNQWQELLKKI